MQVLQTQQLSVIKCIFPQNRSVFDAILPKVMYEVSLRKYEKHIATGP